MASKQGLKERTKTPSALREDEEEKAWEAAKDDPEFQEDIEELSEEFEDESLTSWDFQ